MGIQTKYFSICNNSTYKYFNFYRTQMKMYDKTSTENSILLISQIGAKCKEIRVQIFNEYNIQIFMIKKQYTIKTRLEMREEMSCFKIRILYNFATRKEKYLPQAKFFSSILFIDSYRSRYFKPKLIIGLIRSFRLCKTMCTYFVKTKI